MLVVGLGWCREAVMAASNWLAACLLRLFRRFASSNLLRLVDDLGAVIVVADYLAAGGGECGPVVACTVS